jgi:hypothetical protein
MESLVSLLPFLKPDRLAMIQMRQATRTPIHYNLIVEGKIWDTESVEHIYRLMLRGEKISFK